MTLICPTCRREDHDGLHLWTLDRSEPARSEPERSESGHGAPCWTCRGCGCVFAEIEGVPLISRDASALGAVATPHSEEVAQIYQRSTEGALQDWLRRVVGPGAIELGSGLGVRTDSVLVDNHLGVLLAASNSNRVCADIHAPPFAPASFGTVVLANVLDSVGDPLHVFRSAVALCEPGARLIVTCPFAFNATITPPEHWFAPEQLVAAFGAVGAGLLHLEEHGVQDWPLRVTDRLTHLFRTDTLIFRRNADPG